MDIVTDFAFENGDTAIYSDKVSGEKYPALTTYYDKRYDNCYHIHVTKEC